MNRVKKYGGTVLTSWDDIKHLAKDLAEDYNPEDETVVVVGAIGGETNKLVGIAKEFGMTSHNRETDQLIAIGEQTTAVLVALGIQSYGVPVVSLNGFQAGLITDDKFGESRIIEIELDRIRKELDKKKIVVVTGFQGVTKLGDITTFGANYGGSDLTATVLAVHLGFACELYKGINGIHTVDPKHFEKAKKIDEISYTELIEMSVHGTAVVDARALEYGSAYGLKIYVGNPFLEEKFGGTNIVTDELKENTTDVTGLSISDKMSLVTVKVKGKNSEIIQRMFSALHKNNINIDIIIKQELFKGTWGVSFSCDNGDVDEAISILQSMTDSPALDIEYKKDLIAVSIIGVGMVTSPGIANRAFTALFNESVEIYNTTTSETSITITLEESDKMKAILALCNEYNL